MSMETQDLRAAARKRLDDRRGFFPHLIIYVCVNAGLIALWLLSAEHTFFWPGFVLGFWGIGLLMHAWQAFFSRPVTEADVEREMRRLAEGPHKAA